MSYTSQKEEKYTLFKVTAEKLDTLVAPSVKSELVVIGNNGERNIIMDLSSTRYCDSSGLSAILVGNRISKEAGGTFVLCGLQPSVLKLIEISQLDSILNITPTVNEAVDFLFMEEIEKGLGDS
jgi:anti-sigma B factor antagonist